MTLCSASSAVAERGPVVTLVQAARTTTIDASGFKLPWKAGVTFTVVQGWNGSYSHQCAGSHPQACYAYDFNLPEGTEVLAAKAGTVAAGTSAGWPADHCGVPSKEHPKIANEANRVVINDTVDGYATLYLHLARVLVKAGDKVQQGTPIGYSGKTGWTNCTPHLHFQVQAQGGWWTQSVKFSFDEYPGRELARGARCTSKNSVSSTTVGHGTTANLLSSPSFERNANGWASWRAAGRTTNMQIYQQANAPDGHWILETNTGSLGAAQGASVYQDVTGTFRIGATYWASIYVRSPSGKPFHGVLALWGLPNNEAHSTPFTATSTWTLVAVHSVLTHTHGSLRFQLYESTDNVQLDVDDAYLGTSCPDCSTQGGPS